MSFMEKVGSIMRRPGEDAVPKDEIPWWMKYGGRGLGTVGGGIAIFLGLWNCVGIIFGNISSIMSGIWQMCAGFSAIVIEAPCCCMFLDFVQSISTFVDQRPYWNRAVWYGLIAIPPIILYPGLGSILGSGLIFATGVIYGMMALGKKGSREDMAAMASPTGVVVSHPGATAPPESTLMEDPDVWRPTASVDEMKAAAQTETSSLPEGSNKFLVGNAAPMGHTSPLPPV